jgi:Squalene-hopene cyclase C-terminal domain
MELAEIAVTPRLPGEFWLDGDAVFCGCPDCRAPMSVRVWLMLADCWRCGTSIELTEEQESEVQRLLAEPARPEILVPPPAKQAGPNVVPEEPEASSLPADGPATDASAADLLPAAVDEVMRGAPWQRRQLSEMPAWLISMLVHLLLFVILALLTTEPKPQPGPFITLSAVLNRKVTEGGDMIRIPPDVRAQFDLPLPSRIDWSDDRQRRALLAAAQDARDLRLAEDTPNLPDIRAVKARVGRADGYDLALAARDPRLRAEVVTQEGGTTLTEAAVARGLKWLANHQNDDGSWSLAGFRHAADCKCSGDGTVHAKSPGTALALLPFLGAGQTHLAGKYKGVVSRGLRWLIEHQDDDGDLRAGAVGNEGMYTHGQAAIVLCEAFAMTGDELLRGPSQKAIDFISDAQYNDGGWRYRPRPRSQPGDTSVFGWQLMALQSARSAGLMVPKETWEMADVYLDGVQLAGGAAYVYQPRNKPSAAMTAEALLCRIYLGWTKERAGLMRGVRLLSKSQPPSPRSKNIYYWYYATQVMHHVGGTEWEEWNQQMRDILVRSQERQGHLAGSWDPTDDTWADPAGGRIYMTALAICTLEVYYRHLPIFRRIDLD